MPTRKQIIVIQQGARSLSLITGKDDARYRMLLANVGHVTSSKLLDNEGVENVMAVLEDMGFDQHPAGATYWRDKVARRGSFVNARMLNLIERLASQSRYCLPALAERFSSGRTSDVQKLTPKEAWNLIEMLKATSAREGNAEPSAVSAQPSAHPPHVARVSNPCPSPSVAPSVARASRPCASPSLFGDETPAPKPKRRQLSPTQAAACRAQYSTVTEDEEDVPF